MSEICDCVPKPVTKLSNTEGSQDQSNCGPKSGVVSPSYLSLVYHCIKLNDAWQVFRNYHQRTN